MGRCCVRLTIRFIYKAPEVSVTGISPGLQKLHLQDYKSAERHLQEEVL